MTVAIVVAGILLICLACSIVVVAAVVLSSRHSEKDGTQDE
jgi:Na+-transporting NADH:ubiquinone oxidoreductase subunit NqrC